MNFRKIMTGLTSCVVFLSPISAYADSYPERAIRVIVPFAPGGNLDLTTRLLAKYMEPSLGQPLVVENRGGGNGVIGMRNLQMSKPDGYTLAVSSGGPLIAQPVMQKDVSYTYKDFTPIGLISITPLVFVVPENSRFKSIEDFVNEAKEKPDTLNYGSAGSGTANNIGFEVFKQMAGIEVQHIPYRGSAPVITDLMGGQIPISLEQVTGVSGHLQNGTLRPLAVSTQERVKSMPNVPTMNEIGFKDFNESTWIALVAPGGLPEAIATKLADALEAARENPEFVKQLDQMGAIPADSDRESFSNFLKVEDDKFNDLADRIGLRDK